MAVVVKNGGNPKMASPGEWNQGGFNLRSNSWWFNVDPESRFKDSEGDLQLFGGKGVVPEPSSTRVLVVPHVERFLWACLETWGAPGGKGTQIWGRPKNVPQGEKGETRETNPLEMPSPMRTQNLGVQKLQHETSPLKLWYVSGKASDGTGEKGKNRLEGSGQPNFQTTGRLRSPRGVAHDGCVRFVVEWVLMLLACQKPRPRRSEQSPCSCRSQIPAHTWTYVSLFGEIKWH